MKQSHKLIQVLQPSTIIASEPAESPTMQIISHWMSALRRRCSKRSQSHDNGDNDHRGRRHRRQDCHQPLQERRITLAGWHGIHRRDDAPRSRRRRRRRSLFARALVSMRHRGDKERSTPHAKQPQSVAMPLQELPHDIAGLVISFMYDDAHAIENFAHVASLHSAPSSWPCIKKQVSHIISESCTSRSQTADAARNCVFCAFCAFPMLYPVQLQDCQHVACGRCVYEAYTQHSRPRCATCNCAIRARPQLLEDDWNCLTLMRLYWLSPTYNHFRFVLGSAERPVHRGRTQNRFGENGNATVPFTNHPFYGLGFATDYDLLPTWDLQDVDLLENLDPWQTVDRSSLATHADRQASSSIATQDDDTATTVQDSMDSSMRQDSSRSLLSLDMQRPHDRDATIHIMVCRAMNNYSPITVAELVNYAALQDLWPNLVAFLMPMFPNVRQNDLILVEECVGEEESSPHLEIKLVGWEHLAQPAGK